MFRRILIAALAVLVLATLSVGAAGYWFFSGDGVRRALESQSSAWLGQPVRIGGARPRLLPRVGIELTDVQVGEPPALTLANLALSADLRPLLSRRIENADVLVSGSRIDMPLPFGLPRSAPETSDSGERNVELISVRSIALRDVRLRSRGREIAVSADSSLTGDTLALTRFSAESGATRLEVQGSVMLAPRVDARLTAKANRLDLDELLALADAFTPPSGPRPRGAAPAMRIVATIEAGEAVAGPLRIAALKGELRLDGDAVSISPVSFEAFDGRYEGAIDVRLGRALSATLKSRVTNVDVGQLAAFGGTADAATGRLSGAGTFTGTGSDIATVLASARGSGTATIIDGTIRRLHLVRTVVLFFGRPAPDAGEGSGDSFERMDAAFSLADRRLRADALTLHSGDADMSGTGSLDLRTEALEGRLDVVLSEALSKQAGTDLYRYAREGNRIVLPATLGGTLGDPRLRIDAQTAIGRGIRNEIQERLKGLFGGER